MKRTDKKKMIKVALFLFKQELLTPKTGMILTVMIIYLYSNMEPIKMFADAVNVKVTPMSSIFLFSDFTCQTTILLGLLFLISNAPFRGGIFRYMVSRTGYKNWTIGTVLYLLLLTFLYVVFIVLMSNLSLWKTLDLHLEWGKIWGTLARTDAADSYGITFGINDYIIGKYNAGKAFLVSFILEWVCMFWLALCTYLLNAMFKKGVGIVASSLFIFLDTMIYNSWTPWAYRISPVTLANIASYTKSNLYYGITFLYAAGFFSISIVGFIFLVILHTSKTKDILDFN